MTRLDRLLTLLENCPNDTLRTTAAQQLGQLAKKAPEDVDLTLSRLRGILHSKSWRSRTAAAEAIRAMISNMPVWKPIAKIESSSSSAQKQQTASFSSFLSLTGLNLDMVLENGARLYSMGIQEFNKTRAAAAIPKPSSAKRAKRASVVDSKDCVVQEELECRPFLDRSKINQQLGLGRDIDGFVSSVIEQNTSTALSEIILEADLRLQDVEVNETEPNVVESVKRAYSRAIGSSQSNDTSPVGDDAVNGTPTNQHTDWPLNGICVGLLADLWDCRWETRHGAASGLRELLSSPQHTKQAGARNSASAAENALANHLYLEDIVVRVLCTLALDQFSDFACDVVVAPVRQTAAQLLGVLALHLDFDQIKEVVRHLLCLISMLRHVDEVVALQAPPGGRKSPPSHKVNWMVVHSGLLGLNCLLSTRRDMAEDLLPLVYPSLTSMLIDGAGEMAQAGEEDLRSAACTALLALPSDLLLSYNNAGKWLTNHVWLLLEQANELSPATGPLLALASELLKVSLDQVVLLPSPDTREEIDDSQELVARVNLVLHFLHHSSSDIRWTAVHTLQSLLSEHLQKRRPMEPLLLEAIFEQLFHRILLESGAKPIQAICKLWNHLVDSTPESLLVQATLNRVDFWLCQVMQPASMPFAESMLRLPLPLSNRGVSNECRYIGGYELGSTDERSRQVIALETRITATLLLANLCSRLCQSATPTSSGDHSGGHLTEISVSSYLIDHVVSGVHLRDRLAIQRFVAGLLLAVWPTPCALKTTDLQSRIHTCLTSVTYYEEILGVFKVMQEDCHRLRVQCETASIILSLQVDLPKVEGVLNLVQCQDLLRVISEGLKKAQHSAVSTNSEMEYLFCALRKAQMSVNRCLVLQLFWSSRVELSLSSALVNFGWIVPGSLTPLIRPLMETVRVDTPQPPASISNDTCFLPARDAADLPSPGENLRLQRLAAWNLARLLWSEYQQITPSTSNANPSKALSRVTQNLAKYIFPDEFDDWGALLAKVEEDKGLINQVCLTIVLLKPPTESSEAFLPSTTTETSISSPLPAPNSKAVGNPLSSALDTTTQSPKKSCSPVVAPNENRAARQSVLTTQFRRSGSLVALVALVRAFSVEAGLLRAEEILALRLPMLWQLLWTEPLSVLRGRSFSHKTTDIVDTFATDVEFLRHRQAQYSTNSPVDVKVLSQSLYLMPAVFLAYEGDHAPPAAGLLGGLLALALCCLSLPRLPRLRYVAANTLGLIATVSPAMSVQTLNTLLVGLMPSESREDKDQLEPVYQIAALEAIYHIIDCLLTPRVESLVFRMLRIAPVDQPLSFELHGIGFKEAVVTMWNGDALPIQSLLVYVVVMLTVFVLHRFADPRPDVRLLASGVFIKLLILLPLEESASEPQNPPMHPILKTARERGRQFVHCLLRPAEIRLYRADNNVKAELRPYQQEGVNWLLFLKQYGLNGILADDLGLGKTLQAICALANHHRGCRKHPRPTSLVVCPPTLCSHWLTEVAKFVPNRRVLYPVIYQGTLDQRTHLQKNIPSNCNLLITTYDIVRHDESFFQGRLWEYLILDEGHIIKNSKSKVSRVVKSLNAKCRLILTGTPVQNRVNELWSLFDFLMPGFLGHTESSFVARFARPVLSSRDPKATPEDQRAGKQTLEDLHRIILPFVLRRMKEDVLQELPPKVIQDYLCCMTQLQLKLYESLASTDEGQQAVTLANQAISSSDRFSTSKRLRGGFRSMKYLLAVCNHPSLVLTPGHPLYRYAIDSLSSSEVRGLNDVQLSGKLVALRQLFIDCGFGEGLGRGLSAVAAAAAEDDVTEGEVDLLGQHRALVFFQTKKMLSLVINLLTSEFKNVAFLRLDGTVSVTERQDVVNRFNEDPSIDMLLLTTAVGGLGLNLTGADTVVFVEHDWNPCRDLQAMDRAHRIGQRRMVNVYRLVTADSIEERIMNLQAFKTHLARTLISQPANTSLANMDTAHLLDNLTGSKTADGILSAQGVTEKSAAASTNWGDLEASQYAEEYNMCEFVSRLPPPSSSSSCD